MTQRLMMMLYSVIPNMIPLFQYMSDPNEAKNNTRNSKPSKIKHYSVATSDIPMSKAYSTAFTLRHTICLRRTVACQLAQSQSLLSTMRLVDLLMYLQVNQVRYWQSKQCKWNQLSKESSILIITTQCNVLRYSYSVCNTLSLPGCKDYS